MKTICMNLLLVLFLSGCSATGQMKAVNKMVSEKKDSVDYSPIKKSYHNRLVERIVQLSDYVDLVKNDRVNEEAKLYYVKKAKELFADSGKVRVSSEGTIWNLSVDSLFQLMLDEEFVLKKINSVDVPLWVDELTGKKDRGVIESRVQTYLCENRSFVDSRMDVYKLPIIREQTEEGAEWIPLLGNLNIDGYLRDRARITYSYSPLKLDTLNWTGDLDKMLYQTRIKLVDEFFDRFNGKEGRVDVDNASSDARLKNLLLLFDGKMFNSFQDPLFNEALAMADRILSDSIVVNYEDSTWFAKALCRARLNGKQVSFTLYLNVESRGDDMYKWVITRAEGDALKLLPSLCSDDIMLMPDDHETNFLSLHRVTTEKDDYITNYARKNYSIDETSVFYSLVYNGLLDIEGVDELEFIFLQVPGYVFTIKEFERDGYNAGWLINSFVKKNDKEKRELLNSMYKD